MLPGVEPLDSTHDNMLMLWSVLADAGPRTGDGDVSAISPTVDDGAGSKWAMLILPCGLS